MQAQKGRYFVVAGSGMLLQVHSRLLQDYVADAKGSLQDHYYLATGSLLRCYRIGTLLQVQLWSLQDHSTVATRSQFFREATRSFCCALKGNQRGLVASYRDPFDSVMS